MSRDETREKTQSAGEPLSLDDLSEVNGGTSLRDAPKVETVSISEDTKNKI